MSLKNQFLNNYTAKAVLFFFFFLPPLDYEILLTFINNHPFQILSTCSLDRYHSRIVEKRALFSIIIINRYTNEIERRDLYAKKEKKRVDGRKMMGGISICSSLYLYPCVDVVSGRGRQ